MKGSKKLLVFSILAVMVGVLVTGCLGSSASTTEHTQQEAGIEAILKNQPVPDLGGFSFERSVLITNLLNRNKQINTYTYMFLEYTGKVVKICDSKGYPIPYATQLTNPLQLASQSSYSASVIGNPEPSSLYTPSSAAGTWVQCVNKSGQVQSTYWENNVFALPYELANVDIVLTPAGQ